MKEKRQIEIRDEGEMWAHDAADVRLVLVPPLRRIDLGS